MPNPSIHPQFRSKAVCSISCKFCENIVSHRGMRAILLGDTKVELYSTDYTPKDVQLIDTDYTTSNCRCKIRDIACLVCGNICGYHVTQPCERCLESCNNGHFYMFHSDSVKATERLDKHGMHILWAHLPIGGGMGESKKCLPYQEECVQRCLAKMEKGVLRQAVSLPVGSGKTVVFCHLIKELPRKKKTLILAHRDELLQQAFAQCTRFLPQDIKLGIDQGIKKPDSDCDIIIASVNTLGRAGTQRLKAYNPDDFQCIIIDETHHATANSYTRILKHFKVFNEDSKILVWGCSATLRRHDGVRLGDIFDEIVYSKPIAEMMKEKWLCDMIVKKVKTDVVVDNLSEKDGDFLEEELSQALNVPTRNRAIVQLYKQMVAERNRTSTLVFGINVQHVYDLVKLFQSHGIDARGIDGTTKSHVRKSIISDFREKKFPVLVNCAIVTEGTDIPCIDHIILARPTKSSVLLQQMIGRGLRLSPGKDYCLILDLEDCMKESAMRATIPTLFGLPKMESCYDEFSMAAILDREELIQEHGREAVVRVKPLSRSEREQEIQSLAASKTVREDPRTSLKFTFSEIQDFFSLPPGSSYEDYQRFEWVCVKPNIWMITLRQNETLIIENDQQEDESLVNIYKKTMVTTSSGKRVSTIDVVCQHDCLSSAFNAANHYIVEEIGFKASLMLRSFAKWRREPPTENQIELLSRWHLLRDNLTRGQASDLLMKRFNSSFKVDKELKQKVKKFTFQRQINALQ